MSTETVGAQFAWFRQHCTNKLLPCEICGRAIVTKAINTWAAHWDCVVPHG